MNKIKTKITQKGFTLIELLVVISIIGVLSTIVLSSLNSARAKSRDARRLSDIKQIELALFMVADKNNGTFPSTGGGASGRCLGTTGTCWSGNNSGDAALNASIQEFLPSIPSDPSRSSGRGDRYIYAGPGTVTVWHCSGAIPNPTGPFIIWLPENLSTPYSDDKCKGLGFYACTGAVVDGYYCAYKIQ